MFVPRALGFVKDDDMVGRGFCEIANALVTEVVHVLNERLHLLAYRAHADCLTASSLTRDFIAGESFL